MTAGAPMSEEARILPLWTGSKLNSLTPVAVVENAPIGSGCDPRSGLR